MDHVPEFRLQVDAFLGIPYVSPPVGQFRFMPPMSPQPWTVVRDCTEFSPVCPQIIPDLTDSKNNMKALRYIERQINGFFDHF